MNYRMPGSGPLADFYSRWTDWLIESHELTYFSVRSTYIYRLNAFFSELLPDHSLEQLSELGTADLHSMVERYRNEHEIKRPLWPALRRFYDFAVLEGFVCTNPAVPPEPVRSELEQFYDRWMLAMYKQGFSPSEQSGNRRLASRFLKNSGLPAEPASFGVATIDHFHRYYEANKLEGSIRRRVFRTFEMALDAAVEQGYAAANVLTGYWHLFERPADAPAIDVQAETVMSLEDISDLERRLALTPGDEWLRLQDLALVALFYRQRMIPVEVFSMRDGADGRFSISVRGKVSQTVELDPECLARIGALLEKLPYPRRQGEPIFWGDTGEPLDHNRLGKRWRIIPAGDGNLTARLLRNSSLAHAKDAGFTVDEIQASSRMKHGITIADGVEIDLGAFMRKYAQVHPRYDH